MENKVSAEPTMRLTPEEYLALERKAESKSEYLNGEMFAMSGASLEHAQIVANVTTELGTQFVDRPCGVYPQDLRVKVSRTGLYTYPDLAIVCGEPKLEDDHFDTLLNPSLIIEVLSESTESYDRGRKFAQYRMIESLSEYVLISQLECRVERFSRQNDGSWLYTECVDPDGAIELSSVAARLSMDRVYHRIDFARTSQRQP